MSDISNSQLAEKISSLLDRWLQRESEYNAWINGVAGGGDASDGRFPLTDYLGVVHDIKSPAQLEADVEGLVDSASSHSDDSAASATAAAASATAAATSETNANTYKVAAQTAKTAAEAARDSSLTNAANSSTYADNSSDSADAAAASATAAAASETAAGTSETNAAASATAAATSESDAASSATDAASSASDAADSATAAAASAASITGANPSASIGLTAVNGTSTSMMRADAAPALSQAIAPVWTSAHVFGSQNTSPPSSGASMYASAAHNGVAATFFGAVTGNDGLNFNFYDVTNSAYRGFVGFGTSTVTGAFKEDLGISPGASGRVLIGTENGGGICAAFGSGSERLSIYAADTVGDCFIRLKDSAGSDKGYIGYGESSSDNFYIDNMKNAQLHFATNDTVRMTIEAAGKVTINERVNFKQFTTGGATAGSQSLPSGPVGFVICEVNGTTCKIPYYGA